MSIYGYTAERCAWDTVALAGRKLKITEMRIPSKGEIVRTDTAYPGEIVILADDTLKLNDILGNENLIKHGLIIPCHYFGQR